VGATGVAVGVGVEVALLVAVRVEVRVDVAEANCVRVAVAIGVAEGRLVAVAVGALVDVAVATGACVAVRVAVAVGGAVLVALGVPVAVLAGGAVAEGELVGTRLDVKLMISFGAVIGDASRLVTNFLPQAPPVPVKMIERLLPLCQSPRLTTSCRTGAISSRSYQVFASHWVSELWTTLRVVSVRCDGRLLAENVGLLPIASAARLMLTRSHWDWLE